MEKARCERCGTKNADLVNWASYTLCKECRDKVLTFIKGTEEAK